MKKLLLTIFIVLLGTMSMYSQSKDSEILIWGGIKEGMTSTQFKTFLKNKKCTEEPVDVEGAVVFKGGSFLDASVKFTLGYFYKDKLTKVVIIHEPVSSNFKNILSSYIGYQKLFIKKYDSPDNENFEFSDPYEYGDGQEMIALANDKASIYTFWEFLECMIALQINQEGSIQFIWEFPSFMNFIKNKDNKNFRDI